MFELRIAYFAAILFDVETSFLSYTYINLLWFGRRRPHIKSGSGIAFHSVKHNILYKWNISVCCL